MSKITRTYGVDIEKRNAEDESEDALVVTGHASVFNQRTLIGSKDYGFVERIAPGAFDDVLGDDVRFLENHAGVPFARTTNGTLTMTQDEQGLAIRAELNPEMQSARDHYAAIQRGDIDQMSFAFSVRAQEIEDLPEDDSEFPNMRMRTVTKVERLYDVSGVTYPAYEGASINARAAEIEAILDTSDEISGVNTDAGNRSENSESNDDELLAALQQRSERRQRKDAQ